MLLGIERPTLDFVVSEAGPTHIPAIRGNAFADEVREAGMRAFGPDAHTLRSPLARAQRLTMPLLMGNAVNDPFVPIDQMQRMDAARPRTTTVTFTAGSIPWVHSGVSSASMDQFTRAEDRIAASVALPRR